MTTNPSKLELSTCNVVTCNVVIYIYTSTLLVMYDNCINTCNVLLLVNFLYCNTCNVLLLVSYLYSYIM